jgi:glycosyltransferase involved in cell wall biosynthesis
MLRVLVLSTIFPTAAAPYIGNFIEHQLVGLAARPGIRPTILAPYSGEPSDGCEVSRENWKSLDVIRLRLPKGRTKPESVAPALADAVLPLARELHKTEGFDVLAAELLWPDGPAIARVGRALKLPFSIKARGHEFFEHFEGRPKLLSQALEAGCIADKLLAVSSSLRDRMIDAGFPANRIDVHFTGVDRDLFRPCDRSVVKAQLNISGPLLLSVGNLIPAKGHVHAIEAVSQMPGATLLIAGGGRDGPALQARVKALGLEQRVRLLGHVPHLMLPRLMAAADVTILASAREGLANVWVESLACGTPVVTTDVDGAREVIDRPEAGRIVAREPGDIVAAVRDLLADPPPPELVRCAADRFSWDKNAEALAHHLRKIAHTAPERSGRQT